MNGSQIIVPAAGYNGDKKLYNQQSTLQNGKQQCEFLQAMKDVGIICNEPIHADGKIHRFATGGQKDKNCWYVFFGMAGAFGDWSKDIKETWSSSINSLTPAEKKSLQAQIEIAKRSLQSETEVLQRESAIQAQNVWALLSKDGSSLYLTKKQIEGLGVKYENEILVVPLRDVHGQICSLQRIYADGQKRFFPGGRTLGCFYVLGEINSNSTIYITEGYATAASIHMATGQPVVVCFSAHNLEPVIDSFKQNIRHHTIVICGDDDRWKGQTNAGRVAAENAAEKFQTSLIFPTFACTDTKPTDFNDLHCLEGLEVVKRQLNNCVIEHWSDPKPLDQELISVLPLTEDMLPEPIREWVTDIAYRMQCPLDYVAIPAIVMFGSLIGTRCTIRPKQNDPWCVTPNLWGCIVGQPGSLKSPALAEVLKPISRIEAAAHELYKKELLAFTQANEKYKIEKKAIISDYKKSFVEGKGESNLNHQLSRITLPTKPKCVRYKANDSTVEKMCEILADNTRGLLLERDELCGLFSQWDQKGHECDRTFYLEAWNGTNSYTSDRIGRGTTHAPIVCLSIIGGTQPDKITPHVYEVVRGHKNDGLIQRFQLLVFPEITTNWQLVDTPSNVAAQKLIFQICESITSMQFESVGAQKDEDGKPFFKFSDEAQKIFNRWLTHLETEKLRSSIAPSYMKEHLTKYRKLMPSLALIFHILNSAAGAGRNEKQISTDNAQLATRWCEYLESHAQKIYALGSSTCTAAQVLLEHVLKKELKDGFTLRDVYRKKWRYLGNRYDAEDAVNELVELGYLKEKVTLAAFQQKEKVSYFINPKSWSIKQ